MGEAIPGMSIETEVRHILSYDSIGGRVQDQFSKLGLAQAMYKDALCDGLSPELVKQTITRETLDVSIGVDWSKGYSGQ